MQQPFTLWTLVAAMCWLAADAAAQTQPPAQPPAQPTPIMTLDQVRVGMTGYGKTVFHGDAIEPFAIEVVSVVSDSSAKRGTIWVVCPDERMRLSGPVQGMSGSPMYLWDAGETGTLGEGGRLIGAFAFGYSDVNVCLVGVQPIEYMREVAARALDEDLDEKQASRVPPGTLANSLAAMRATADRLGIPRAQRSGLDAVTQLTADPRPTAERRYRSALAPGPLNAAAGQVMPMRLPICVGSTEAAALLGPLFEPAGYSVMAGGMAGGMMNVAGKPPSNVDPSRVKLEPGSVLSIPLAFGDLDLNAAGTVTDVLPDGTVLAFGHAMNAVGSSRLPMATGYTHFVVSRDSISFKLGSSLDIVGSVVRDEASAIAGVAEQAFIASPVAVHVTMPGQPARDYQYQVVDDFQLTPAILAAVANASLNAVQGPPQLHTVTATGTLTFTGERELSFKSVTPNGGIVGLIFEMLPPVMAMMQNPFEPVKLVSADIALDVENGVNLASMLHASLDRRVVQPGDTVNISLQLQPFDQPLITRTLPFTLPSDLAAGEYQLIVSDAASYEYRMIASHPDMADIDDVDELQTALQRLATIDDQMIYVGLPQLTPGIAVGGRAMEHLPSSRALLLAGTASSSTLPYPRFIEQQYPAESVVEGELMLPLRVVVDAP